MFKAIKRIAKQLVEKDLPVIEVNSELYWDLWLEAMEENRSMFVGITDGIMGIYNSFASAQRSCRAAAARQAEVTQRLNKKAMDGQMVKVNGKPNGPG